MAETNLEVLLREMRPVLAPVPYGYAFVLGTVPEGLRPFAVIQEDEGTTLVAERAALAAVGLDSDPWARISLTVHSDLAAVGLTAAIATALTREGISANVVAGYFHDHIFVAWDHRAEALAALAKLA